MTEPTRDEVIHRGAVAASMGAAQTVAELVERVQAIADALAALAGRNTNG